MVEHPCSAAAAILGILDRGCDAHEREGILRRGAAAGHANDNRFISALQSLDQFAVVFIRVFRASVSQCRLERRFLLNSNYKISHANLTV